MYDDCTLSLYAIFCTAVAFSVHTGAVLVLHNKVTPRVADGRSVPVGDADRGERGQKKMLSHSHKSVWGQRSGKHLLWPEGTLLRWERPVAVVGAAHFSMWVGGSLSQNELTFEQR